MPLDGVVTKRTVEFVVATAAEDPVVSIRGKHGVLATATVEHIAGIGRGDGNRDRGRQTDLAIIVGDRVGERIGAAETGIGGVGHSAVTQAHCRPVGRLRVDRDRPEIEHSIGVRIVADHVDDGRIVGTDHARIIIGHRRKTGTDRVGRSRTEDRVSGVEIRLTRRQTVQVLQSQRDVVFLSGVDKLVAVVVTGHGVIQGGTRCDPVLEPTPGVEFESPGGRNRPVFPGDSQEGGVGRPAASTIRLEEHFVIGRGEHPATAVDPGAVEQQVTVDVTNKLEVHVRRAGIGESQGLCQQ